MTDATGPQLLGERRQGQQPVHLTRRQAPYGLGRGAGDHSDVLPDVEAHVGERGCQQHLVGSSGAGGSNGLTLEVTDRRDGIGSDELPAADWTPPSMTMGSPESTRAVASCAGYMCMSNAPTASWLNWSLRSMSRCLTSVKPSCCKNSDATAWAAEQATGFLFNRIVVASGGPSAATSDPLPDSAPEPQAASNAAAAALSPAPAAPRCSVRRSRTCAPSCSSGIMNSFNCRRNQTVVPPTVRGTHLGSSLSRGAHGFKGVARQQWWCCHH